MNRTRTLAEKADNLLVESEDASEDVSLQFRQTLQKELVTAVRDDADKLSRTATNFSATLNSEIDAERAKMNTLLQDIESKKDNLKKRLDSVKSASEQKVSAMS